MDCPGAHSKDENGVHPVTMLESTRPHRQNSSPTVRHRCPEATLRHDTCRGPSPSLGLLASRGQQSMPLPSHSLLNVDLEGLDAIWGHQRTQLQGQAQQVLAVPQAICMGAMYTHHRAQDPGNQPAGAHGQITSASWQLLNHAILRHLQLPMDVHCAPAVSGTTAWPQLSA